MTTKKEQYNNEYRKKNVKSILLRFYPTERDMYDYIERQGAKATYIKSLIRKDMDNGA